MQCTLLQMLWKNNSPIKIFMEFYRIVHYLYIYYLFEILCFMYISISFLFSVFCLWPYLSLYVRRFRNNSRDNLEPIGKYKRDKRCEQKVLVGIYLFKICILRKLKRKFIYQSLIWYPKQSCIRITLKRIVFLNKIIPMNFKKLSTFLIWIFRRYIFHEFSIIY